MIAINEMSIWTGALGSIYDPLARDSQTRTCITIDNISTGETYGRVAQEGFVRTPKADFLQVNAETADGVYTDCFTALYKNTDGWSGLHNSVSEITGSFTHLWPTNGSGPWSLPAGGALHVDPSGNNIISVGEIRTVTGSLSSPTTTDSKLFYQTSTDGGVTWAVTPVGTRFSPTPESGYVYGDLVDSCFASGTFYIPSTYQQLPGPNNALSILAFTPGAATNAVPGSMVPTAASDWAEIASTNGAALTFATAQVSNAVAMTDIGPQAGRVMQETAITALPNGKLLVAIRTTDFFVMSIGTNSGGTWTWRDPWGSGNALGICDGQGNRPLIPCFSCPPSLASSSQLVYLLAPDYGQAALEVNRTAANIWQSPDGIAWTPSAIGPLFRGGRADYGQLIVASNRLLFLNGLNDNQIRLYTSPQIGGLGGSSTSSPMLFF